ncbi:hypothetical protein IQ07DRAFT_678583 [Pyrenochaeta sp. DS3sAY3a]|nr:hypothetical protein IQ07DRAFT_678583 [Pyrenochaeta sp. DS3sAY3a]
MANEAEYLNPIIPGFAPDPSIVQVDGIFFCCNSSFHIFPGLPVYASKDLQEWVHIGNALNRQSQLSLKGARAEKRDTGDGDSQMVASLGIVAPSIHYNDGTFYIATSRMEVLDGKFKWNSFIIQTTDIWSDQWSDPLFFDWNGIDVSLFFENGRTYVQGSWLLNLMAQPKCSIYQGEIDISTGKWLHPPQEIWAGWAKHDTEGPHTYKVGGFYYLIAAEGGTFEHHMISVARSKDIWGPYISCEDNPILTADGKNEYVQNVGHAGLFQDKAQRWWAVVLGVRRLGNGVLGLGRETFLTAVDWPEGEWPTICQPRMSFTRTLDTALRTPAQFEAPQHIEDVFIRDRCDSSYQYLKNGAIALYPSLSEFADPVETCTFLGRRQRAFDCAAKAEFEVHTGETLSNTGIVAGIALYKDSLRFSSLAYDFDANAVTFTIQNSAKEVSGTITRRLEACPVRVALRIVASPLQYTFEARLESLKALGEYEEGWMHIGNLDSGILDARDYTGPLLGIFAKAQTERALDHGVIFSCFNIA